MIQLFPTLLLLLLFNSTKARQPSLLIYSKTTGYRHDSIPQAISSLNQISINLNLNTTFSEDENLFTTRTANGLLLLNEFDIIGFLSNSNTVDSSNGLVTSDVLTSEGVLALNEWLGRGGSLMGFHAGLLNSLFIYSFSKY